MNPFEDAFGDISNIPTASSSSSSSNNSHQHNQDNHQSINFESSHPFTVVSLQSANLPPSPPITDIKLIYPIGKITLWVDFMYERVTSIIPVNTEELAEKFREKFLIEAKMFELPNITTGQMVRLSK